MADAIEIDFGAPWADAAKGCWLVIVGFALDREALARGFAACAV